MLVPSLFGSKTLRHPVHQPIVGGDDFEVGVIHEYVPNDLWTIEFSLTFDLDLNRRGFRHLLKESSDIGKILTLCNRIQRLDQEPRSLQQEDSVLALECCCRRYFSLNRG